MQTKLIFYIYNYNQQLFCKNTIVATITKFYFKWNLNQSKLKLKNTNVKG